MTDHRLRPSRHTFKKTGVLLDDFFSVHEYRGQYELHAGGMSAEQRTLVFERGDSVAALLYDPSHSEVILVEQFRLPTALRGGDGWILEPTAGRLRTDETPRQCMLREFEEETGYQPSELIPISTFFVSPGGSSERIHLFYAEVRRTQQTVRGGGVEAEGEDIHVVRLPLGKFLAMLRNNEFQDAKLIVAGYWLKNRLEAMSTHAAARQRKVSKRLCMPESKGWFRRSVAPARFVGYYTGNIREIHDVDVWINPLASDMLLDKFTDATVSAAIRAAGAEWFKDQKIKKDHVGDNLRRALNGRMYVEPGKLVATEPGPLRRSNNVRQLLHVSTAHGDPGEPPRADMVTVEACIANVLRYVEDENRYSSVLIPMLGTGQGGLRVKAVAAKLLERAVAFMRENPHGKLKSVYLLAYSEIDADDLAQAFQQRAAAGDFVDEQALPQPDAGAVKPAESTPATSAEV